MFLPRSPLTTRLSGSAGETRARIWSIARGGNRHTPLWLLGLAVLCALLCGRIVSLTPSRQAPPAPEELSVLLAQKTLVGFQHLSARTDPLLVQSTQRYTLILSQVTGVPHVAGLHILTLGLWDNQRQRFADVYCLQGDEGYYTTWNDPDGSLYLLWTNSATSQGNERSCGMELFRFDKTALSPVRQLPPKALERGVLPDTPEAAALLYPFDQTPQGDLSYRFWSDYKAIPAPGGFSLYQRSETAAPVTSWDYPGFVPLLSERSCETQPPADALALIQEALLEEHPAQTIYLSSQAPAQPQEEDLRLEQVCCLGEMELDGERAAAYWVEYSCYTAHGETTDWLSMERYLVFSRDASGAFRSCLGTPDFSPDGMTTEEMIRRVSQAAQA